VQADKLLVYLLDVNNDIPRLSSCIVVHSDLRVTVSLNQAVISESRYEDLLSPAGCLERLSQLINLMARLKAWTSDYWSLPFIVAVDMAVNTLKVGISDLSDDDCSERRRIQFVIEQLKLMSTSKFARHYSSSGTPAVIRHRVPLVGEHDSSNANKGILTFDTCQSKLLRDRRSKAMARRVPSLLSVNLVLQCQLITLGITLVGKGGGKRARPWTRPTSY